MLDLIISLNTSLDISLDTSYFDIKDLVAIQSLNHSYYTLIHLEDIKNALKDRLYFYFNAYGLCSTHTYITETTFRYLVNYCIANTTIENNLFGKLRQFCNCVHQSAMIDPDIIKGQHFIWETYDFNDGDWGRRWKNNPNYFMYGPVTFSPFYSSYHIFTRYYLATFRLRNKDIPVGVVALFLQLLFWKWTESHPNTEQFGHNYYDDSSGIPIELRIYRLFRDYDLNKWREYKESSHFIFNILETKAATSSMLENELTNLHIYNDKRIQSII